MATVSPQQIATNAAITSAGVNTPINQIAAAINGNLDDNNIASLSGTKILAGTLPASALDQNTKRGYITGALPVVSSVTNNGNGSYDVLFASTVATILSIKNRLQFARSTPANTYMGGALNGSSHYFTKTSPTGTLSTVTNNFTIMATYMPTAYPSARAYLGGRADATPNNGLGMFVEPDGRVGVIVFNGGAANYRSVVTNQSVILGKKNVLATSFASGTVVAHINGVSVPVATAVTGGTAPTTAGTGGDFSIGRFGAFPAYAGGYISNFAVFNAVLSTATIRQYNTYKLTGSETNCIGAWSLDNTANDQFGVNNLTATGGVGYSNISPFTSDANGNPGSYDWAVVTKINGATATVQVPEGCSLPTTGGFASVDYSIVDSPFGFPVDPGRWRVSSILRTDNSTTSNANYGAFMSGGFALAVPIGSWKVGFKATRVANSTTTTVLFAVSDTSLTGASATVGANATQLIAVAKSSAAADTSTTPYVTTDKSLSSLANFVMYTLGATTSANITGANGDAEIFAEFGLL